jgi:hypothetical protein
MTTETYYSHSQFMKKYLPKQYEKEKIEKMTPEEFGKYLANKHIAELGRLLKKSE